MTVARDRDVAAIGSALLAATRVMNQPRVHDALCRQAGVRLDRGGSAVLYKLYTEGEDVRVTDLAERLAIDAPAVTRKVQQLERDGLVSRSADPDDARATRLRLTDAGRASIEALLAARSEWLESLLQGWPRRDLEAFARLLDQFAAAVAEDVEARHGR